MARGTIVRVTRILFWAAAAFAYVMAIIPGGEPGLELPNDKANHILAFLTLSLLARLAWPHGQAWIMAVLLIALGGFIEICQAMPLIHRDAEWADFAADAIATVIGLAIGSILLMRRRRRLAIRADRP